MRRSSEKLVPFRALLAVLAGLFSSPPALAPDPTVLAFLSPGNVLDFLRDRALGELRDGELAELALRAFLGLYPERDRDLTVEEYARLDPRQGERRALAMNWLASHGAVAGLEIALVRDPSARARAAAGLALVRSASVSPDLFRRLTKCLNEEPDAQARAACAQSIGGLGIRFEDMRARATSVLTRRGDEELAAVASDAISRALEAIVTAESSCGSRFGLEPS